MNRTISFETINNKQIFTILTEPESSQKRIVIMSHGFRGSSIGPARTFVDFETLLIQNGFSTVRFDQPCSGNSEGDFFDSSFSEWVKTIQYFAKKYLNLGYSVTLLGQSMGASATMIAVSQNELAKKIPKLLLWVPDPKITFTKQNESVAEEGGQKYQLKFWEEARESDFFYCLKNYPGKIHLVYGEIDRYLSKEIKEKVIAEFKKKQHSVLLLPGQDHSPWDFESAQKVYKEELLFLISEYP